MVGKWRARFLQARLEGLYDEPRPGAPRKIGDDQIEQIVIQTLESTPRGQTHWSTRELAKTSLHDAIQTVIGRRPRVNSA
jgi:transposase